MVSVFTPNIQLEEPARGDDVGTWDVPVNNNMTLLDLVCGNITSIALSSISLTLSASQFQSKEIIFTSALTANVTITFPSSFKKSYEIQHLCTGSSAFTITLTTTSAGGQAICCPPGEIIDVVNDGTNLKFKNLGRIGSLWDYAGSSVPSWVSGCTVAPYLNCDGTTFSAATYPSLSVILGSTTLPDIRGVTRATLNQGTARMNSSLGGVDGNTNFARGGADYIILQSSQIPANIPNTLNLNTGGTNYTWTTSPAVNTNVGGGVGASIPAAGYSAVQLTGTVTINSSLGGNQHINMQPTTVAGITMIRAA